MKSFERVILIGFGKIFHDCLITIKESFFGKIDLLVYENSMLGMPKSIGEGVHLHNISDISTINDFFRDIKEETLVISANNNYIFRSSILEKKNLTIINFHNSLLPNHKGRNSPTWVIFQQESQTGITWHLVNENIDEGEIICQKKIDVSNHETGLSLARKLMITGAEEFRKIFPLILDKKINSFRQNLEGELHKSKDVPNNGFLDLTWDFDKIYAFLRSLDYGKIDVFDKPIITFLGYKMKILRYSLANTEPNTEKNEHPSFYIQNNTNTITISSKFQKLILKVENL